ncbi:Carbamate kinase 1 [Serratia marcescens]|nr:carbamate kinase [Serratia marcescens]CUZ09570.1 Carbamate kinase 1 [Serratia marcescens]CUZ33379.1 Carbamate kinase 1 [Serratia marcescens]CUZ33921.1 Carbamate kinase 1 [Serratia marcescens]CUZ37225.1 Carbamate kinase 1 [Serratia marcescens]
MIAGERGLTGSEAVIDKDLAAALLAEQVGADHLLILTDADAVYQEWGTPRQRAIRRATTQELAPMAVADGAMGPKIMAVSRFVDRTGRTAHIGGLQDIDAVLAGQAGTSILP